MTALRLVESLRYGGKLAGYLLAVALVGGAAVAGGTALAVPGRLGLETATVGTGRRLGGAALGSFGVFAVVAGLFGLVYKLIADAVSAGVEDGTPTPEPPTLAAATNADGEGFDDTTTATENDEPLMETEPADPPTEATSSQPDPSESDGGRPAPSPGEIVFGSDGSQQGGDPTPGPGDSGGEPDTPADRGPTAESESESDVVPEPAPEADPDPKPDPEGEPEGEQETGADVLTDMGKTGTGGSTSGDPLADPTDEE